MRRMGLGSAVVGGIIVTLGALVYIIPKAREVTYEEKDKLLQSIDSLPRRGEFYTDASLGQLRPLTYILLAISDKNLSRYVRNKGIEEEYDLFPIYMLIVDLVEGKKERDLAKTEFSRIAHPRIKAAWAVGLFNYKKDPKCVTPDIVTFLRKELESEEGRELLTSALGPEFDDFRKRVREWGP